MFLPFIISYFIGAIPFGFLLCKIFKGLDLRKEGSKNPGATNAFRVAGAKIGLSAFFLDLLKGYIAVMLPIYMGYSNNADLIKYQIGCGIFSVIGHNWTIFLNFKGGKGVATSCGLFFGLCPKPTFIVLFIWAVITYYSGFVSLASIISSLILPLLVYLFNAPFSVFVFSGVAGLLITVMHYKNIQRLYRGEENRFATRKKFKMQKSGNIESQQTINKDSISE